MADRLLNVREAAELAACGGRAVPSLDALALRPDLAKELSADTAFALLCQCIAAHGALLGALAVSSSTSRATPEPDSLLDVAQASLRLHVSRDWLYRNAERLPFTVRQGRLLRFSSVGIDRYIRSRQIGR